LGYERYGSKEPRCTAAQSKKFLEEAHVAMEAAEKFFPEITDISDGMNVNEPFQKLINKGPTRLKRAEK
jgi:hypothetical protein